eukprot:TRINITY_DN3349_c0_g1_i5.p1 TRINITY_DN3349_c0_g1~~TRINITY_DN3349_c0_g1_i5.p1  ORF type:complete len:133 (-),score=28.75 TRINITY_DN3349_c0_g1_i5:124-522(-)
MLTKTMGQQQVEYYKQGKMGQAPTREYRLDPITFFTLTPKAFELLVLPLNRRIFISYKRTESSAFALLLKDRLAANGYDVFLDLQSIHPGEDWRVRLESEIRNCDVFVGLLGRLTLDSQPTCQEIDLSLIHI